MSKLKDYAYYVTDRIDASKINSSNYIGMDNLLPNKGGIEESSYTPTLGSVISFKKGDILIGNIRPYFKKIWYATFDGGCSADVLCIRSNGKISSKYLYSLLSQDNFFDYDMKGSKGSKMPRGDKEHIMNFPIKVVDNAEEIGNLTLDIDSKIFLNKKISKKLEEYANLIYERWFLDYKYPGFEEKNNIYSDALKMEIPEDWDIIKLTDLADITWGQCPNGKNILSLETEGENLYDYCSGAGDMKGGYIVSCQAKTDDSKRFANDNDILVSIAGKIGDMCIVDHKISLGRAAMAYTSKEKNNYMFLYLTLSNLNKKITTISSGSIQKVINKEHIDGLYIPYNKNIVSKYSDMCENIFFNLKQLANENNKLIKLRNFIIPGMINKKEVV